MAVSRYLIAPVVLTLAATLLGACAPAEGAAALEIRARPVETPAEVSARGDRIGRLHLLAAFELSSVGSRRLGGLSAVELAGDDMLLLSDRGRLFRARRVEDAAGRLTGLRDWVEVPLPRELRKADPESMTLLPGGDLMVGVEERDTLFRVTREGRVVARRPLPDFALGWPSNEGIEALAALPDGGLLAITEGLEAGPDATVAAYLGDGPRATKLAVRAAGGFRPTDATVAGSTLFLLERKVSLFGGLEARLVAIPVDRVRAAGPEPLDGVELARFGIGAFAANFEGVAARQVAGGGYLIYLVADDNFNPLLPGYLLELAWRPETTAAAR